MNVDPPTRLPAGLKHLSASSVRLFRRDPWKWKLRYVEGAYEPSSPSQLVGAAVHRAEGENFAQKVRSGRDLLVADTLDLYSDEWALAVEEATDRAGVEWEDEKPGQVKDSGVKVLAHFHRSVARHIKPLASEQRFEIALPGVEWTFVGYRDVDEASGAIADMKVRGPTRGPVGRDEAAGDLEATAYLFAKRAERQSANSPIAFNPRHPHHLRFLNLVRHADPGPRHVLVTSTERTDEQLDTFLAVLYRTAAEMVWRVETDNWVGAQDGDPLCAPRYCGFWDRCAFGGAHRPSGLLTPRPIIKPDEAAVIAAVEATTRKGDGRTNAKRVADYLGLPSSRAAAGHLAALSRKGIVASERRAKRFKSKPDVPLSGPREYRLLDDGMTAARLQASLRRNGNQKELTTA